jgi:hypothetical protein
MEDIQQKEAASLRLASVAYNLGMVINPYNDGNGQTFRLVALSYLHELAPQYKDQYLPYRDINNQDTAIGGLDKSDFSTLPGFDDPRLESILDLQRLLKKYPTKPIDGSTPVGAEQWLEQLKADGYATEASTPAEAYDLLVSAADSIASTVRGEETDHRTLEEKTQQEKLHEYLRVALGNTGLDFHKRYVIDGEQNIVESEDAYKKLALVAYERTQKQMVSTLENKSVHKRRFFQQEIIGKIAQKATSLVLMRR